MNVLVIVVLIVLLAVAFGAGSLYGPGLRARLARRHDTPAELPVQDPTLIAPPLPPMAAARATMNTAVVPSQWDGTPVTPITPASTVTELPSTDRHFPENRNEQSELINVDELHRMLAADTGPIRMVGPAQS